MFSSAIDVFNLRRVSEIGRQVIRVDVDPELEILIYDHRTGEISPFDYDPVEMVLSNERMCIGRFEDTYRPCPNRQKVGTYSQCQTCAAPTIPRLECIFEPKCEGELCGHPPFCSREHAIYLAFFDIYPKVGLSSADRVLKRVREQGADGFSIVAVVENRLKARRLEMAISQNIEVKQAYRNDVILDLFTRDVDYQGMEATFNRIAEEIERIFGLQPSPLQTLEYPLEPLDQRPEMVDVPGKHVGEYIGSKGRFLLYTDGTPKAMKVKEMEGRFLLDVL